VPIRNMVIESRRREIRKFFERSMPMRLGGPADPGEGVGKGGKVPGI